MNMDEYPHKAIALALSRGWSPLEHSIALRGGNEDEVALTHPINFLTEAEESRIYAAVTSAPRLAQ